MLKSCQHIPLKDQNQLGLYVGLLSTSSEIINFGLIN